MKRVGAVSALSAPRNHAVCRRVWGAGPSPAHPHPAPILLAGNPGISPVHSFLFMTFSLVPTSFFLLFFPSPPAATKGHPGTSGTPRCHNPRPSAALSAPPRSLFRGAAEPLGRQQHRDRSQHPSWQPRSARKANSTALCLQHAAPRTHRWHYI